MADHMERWMLDGQIDRFMMKQTDKCIKYKNSGKIDKACRFGWNGQNGVWMIVWTDEWIDKQTDG